jgi:hypothetical protein
LNSLKDDQHFIALLKQAPVPSAELINDLSGAHLQTQQSPFVAAASSAELPPTQQTDQHQSKHRHHRAVITSMAPALKRAASKAGDDDGDTASVVTLPMPNRKRRRSEEEDEACSSPNDLVEMPAAAAAAPPAKQQRTSGGRPVAQAAAAAQQDARMGAAARDQAAAAADGGSGTAAAASAAATASAAPAAAAARGIVVSKVLTKSDATSKRIILPRIAVETNLPQLESTPAFHFSALDPAGAPWPLVIKAWANGSNPRPVFVLEQVGEVMKANRLGLGDAVALLADEEGGFFLEWNTPRATAAAARPTASGIVFKHLKKQGSGSSGGGGGAAAPAAAAGKPPKAAAVPAGQEAAAAAPAPVQEQQQPKAAPAAAAAAAAPKLQLQAAPSFPLPEVEAGPQALPQHMMQQRAGGSEAAAVAAAAQPVSAAPDGGPYMTAVPVTSPQVPGTFIPSSPCQLLVLGHMPMPDLELDLERSRPQPALTPALLGSDDAPDGSADAAAGGSVLQCPRTAGCTRPAGHQGWCLGHKGYKKRRP